MMTLTSKTIKSQPHQICFAGEPDASSVMAAITEMQGKDGVNNIINMRHPEYLTMSNLWLKYRKTMKSGKDFIDRYLQKFSNRETAGDFNTRRSYTYCPAHVKSELYKIKNAIYQRLVDIVREGGPVSYREAVSGISGGIDRKGASLTNFIGDEVLVELIGMGKVGVYIDRPPLPQIVSRADTIKYKPYAYVYKAENILSWTYNSNNILQAVLLQDINYKEDEKSGLTKLEEISYRYLKLTDYGVEIFFFDKNGKQTDHQILDLKQIPLVIFKLPESLLTDVADYQIALLNLGSSDINYALRSNYPFYTEQYDLKEVMQSLMKSGAAYDDDGNLLTPGSEAEAKALKDKEVLTGTGQGRRYPKGLDRPMFIHPSPEPLEVSMKKQEELRNEIKNIMQMSLEQLDKVEGNADSGLAFIGSILEKGERNLAIIWLDYEKDTSTVNIKYPQNYTLKSDEDRRKEASEIEQQIAKTSSTTLKKELAKQVASTLIGTKVSKETLEKIYKEIDEAAVIVIDPEVIREDHEAGFVGTELASKLRGYPEGEVEKAKKDHAERAQRIARAQAKVGLDKFKLGNMSTDLNDDVSGAAARGVPDLDTDPLASAKQEKTDSQDTTLQDTTTSRTRGEGK